MEETGKIVYLTEKKLKDDETLYVRISLDDDHGNRVCCFRVTGEIHNRHGTVLASGCIHSDILKVFPEFKEFVTLHLCDCHGAPMYAVENGLYFFRNEKRDIVKSYLRITDAEYDAFVDDRLAFKCLLYDLGIAERWQVEATSAIKTLESLTGKSFRNPYSQETEKRNLPPLIDEERETYNRKLSEGFYTKAEIQKRKEIKERAFITKERRKLENAFRETVAKAQREFTVMSNILDVTGSTDNVIWYDHDMTVVFNWKGHDCLYDKIWYKEILDKLADKAKGKTFPEGTRFYIETKDCREEIWNS